MSQNAGRGQFDDTFQFEDLDLDQCCTFFHANMPSAVVLAVSCLGAVSVSTLPWNRMFLYVFYRQMDSSSEQYPNQDPFFLLYVISATL